MFVEVLKSASRATPGESGVLGSGDWVCGVIVEIRSRTKDVKCQGWEMKIGTFPAAESCLGLPRSGSSSSESETDW